MTTFDTKSLKKESRDRLNRISGDPRLLIGLYTGVIVAINLLVSGLNLALDHQIGSTGGLGGLGTRSILETIQSILTYASVIFTPFWSAGFLFCVIRIVQGDPADPRCLMEGFRRFPSVLLFHVNKLVLTMMIGTTATYLAAIVFMLTPFSAGLEQLTAQAMEAGNLILADGTVNLQIFDPGALVRACIPMLVIFGLLFLPAYLFLSYSLRLSPYLIMGDQRMGGFACMANSFRLMRGNRLKMLRLDLSFWWYYLIDSALTVILYLDLILPLMGIELPFNQTVAFFVCLILYGAAQAAFYMWKKLPVDTTYVLAYDAVAGADAPQQD